MNQNSYTDMANKRTKILQIRRNAEAVTDHDSAIELLKEKLATAKDGEPILVRYTDANGDIKTLLGIASELEAEEDGDNFTIFDERDHWIWDSGTF